MGLLPPGDLRMALTALAGEDRDDAMWASVLQHRFGGHGALAGHPVGNLLISGLMDGFEDPLAALARVADLIGAVGRVLPMSPIPLDLVAEVDRLDPDDPARTRRIRGQSSIAATPGRVRSIRLLPPGAPACAAAVDAVRESDVVVLGPGSWFTSVIPHLLLRELGRAIATTRATVVVTVNLVPQAGETPDFSPQELLRVLREHARDRGGLRIDVDRRGRRFRARSQRTTPVRARHRRASRTVRGRGGRQRGPARSRATGRRVPARSAGDRGRGDGGGFAMAMTAAVKDELSRITVTKPSARRAEIATMLRFAGALHLVGGHIVVEAELDTGSVARRLRKEIAEVFGHGSEVQIVASSGLRNGPAVTSSGSRRTARGWPGSPACRPPRPSGPWPAPPCRGRRHRGRRSGLARRLSRAWLADRARPGLLAGDHLPFDRGGACAWSAWAAGSASPSKAREVRGSDRVVVRDGDAIGALLTRIGAHESVLVWEERRLRREVRATANRLANFDDANLRRSARAAVAAGARVERAMEILGDDAPEHLLQAGRLRLEHKQASLEELGSAPTRR